MYEKEAEPLSLLHPPLFVIVQNSGGNWVIQDLSGMCGGLFVDRKAGAPFARGERLSAAHRGLGFWQSRTRHERRSPVRPACLSRLEQLSKLLEQLAVAREVAGRIFPLHLAEQYARTLQHFVARTHTGRAGSDGCRR